MLFHDISEEIHNWLIKQPPVKEESLTDWFLYTLSEREKNIYYHTFSRHEESLNGSDWEWWVLVNSGSTGIISAYRFLVQAKKLWIDKDNYPLLSYGNRNGIQMDLLIAHAKKKNAFPLYAYYSTSSVVCDEQKKAFPQIDEDRIEWCRGCINGCYLSPANMVQNIVFGSPRSRISDVQLLNNSLGLSLLDQYSNDSTVAEKSLDLLNKYYNQIFMENENRYSNVSDGIRHNEKNIPQYLFAMIQGRGERIDWIEKEFAKEFDEIDGIGVIDLRYNV